MPWLLEYFNPKYDYRELGFENEVEMQAAFVQGYHNKKRLDEINALNAKSLVNNNNTDVIAPEENLDSSSQGVYSNEGNVDTTLQTTDTINNEDSFKPNYLIQTTNSPSDSNASSSDTADVVAPEENPDTAPQESTDTETKQKTAFAPSYDCEKASTGVERLICGDRELSSLDVQMSQLYLRAKEDSLNPSEIKDTQIDWIKFSLRACSDTECLTNAYQKRISELENAMRQ